jgi:hypothetical protein
MDNASQDKVCPEFTDIHEAVETACYVEQLLASEYQWITNRLSWLFVSQSFLVVAFITLITSKLDAVGPWMIRVLTWGLPLVGFIASLLVSLGIMAAQHEAARLSDVRAELTRRINALTPVAIPLIGNSKQNRDTHWARILGAWPHVLLPRFLTLSWLVVLVALWCDAPRF